MDHELDTLQRLAGLEVEVKNIKETVNKIDNKIDLMVSNFPTRQELTAELKSRDEAIAAVWEDLQDFKDDQKKNSSDKKHLTPVWISVIISLIALVYTAMK